jgi:PAS domain S-box-containing protein
MLSLSRAPTAVIRALGLFVAAIGGATLLQHLTGWNLGIDTLLFDEAPGALATSAPGRMGPPASISYLAAGTALVLTTAAGRMRQWSVAFALGVTAVGALSVTGHWYGAEQMYIIPTITGIALQTGLMLLALGVGLIAANRDFEPMRTLGESSNTGMLARRLVPLVIFVPLTIGFLRLQGQELGLYDGAFGAALRTLIEIVLLSGLSWWSLQAIRVHERRQRAAEAARHEIERRLLETIESISDGFITFDDEWRFTYANGEAQRLLGKARDELIGKVVWELFPDAIGSQMFEEFNRAATARIALEVSASDSLGTGRHFINRVYPGVDGGLSVYFQDVTQRKLAEDALRDANRRKDQFLATLAHELRNPLAPVRNAARILAMDEVDDKTRAWATAVIGRQVTHMALLLDDLLDLSRITRDRLELRREWVEVRSIVEVALETSRPGVDQAGHELLIVLPSEPVYVDADALRIAQVISNLLNNAAKYTEQGGHVGLRVVADGREVVISVEDDGIGISAGMLTHVFEMFAQAQPALRRSQGGLGIGLALARGIVGLHGGSIEAHSEGDGKGSRFVVRLPQVTAAVATETAPQGPPVLVTSRRFLVVDDSKDGADSLTMLLQKHGQHAESCYSGGAALERAAQLQPQAIFLDLAMPGLNGYEVCRRIRQEPWGRDIAIVAVTGYGQSEDRRRTEEAGFDYHLTKPADPAAILGIVAKLKSGSAAA